MQRVLSSLAFGATNTLQRRHRLDLRLQCAMSVEASSSTAASLGTVAAVVMVGSLQQQFRKWLPRPSSVARIVEMRETNIKSC